MKNYSLVMGLCGCVLLVGCGGKARKHAEIAPAPVPAQPAMVTPAPPPEPRMPVKVANADWHRVATDHDRERLRTWRTAWTTALAAVQAAGHAAQLAAQGPLFDPDRALADAAPPPGRYKCRVFKLGANGTAMRDFTAYPPYECRIEDEGEVSSLYKIGGSQRPIGLFFPDSTARQIFLGTMMFGDETKPLDYGRDDARDLAGYIERIGEKRWRLVLPWPKFESMLDVVELVPADGPIK